MINVKPNMDCENCWLIVNEFDGDYACDECVADARAQSDNYVCGEPEDDGNLAWAENYDGPGLGGWQG